MKNSTGFSWMDGHAQVKDKIAELIKTDRKTAVKINDMKKMLLKQ